MVRREQSSKLFNYQYLTFRSTYERHESVSEMGGLVRWAGIAVRQDGVFCPGSGRNGRSG
jgi:hypothetical protein